MTDPACSAARRALLAGSTDPRDGEHVAQCPECAAFAARLAVVDVSLEADAQSAAGVRLPAPLRASILSAARASHARPSRGRVFELGLRVAAIAAVLLVMLFAAPDTLLAGELDLTALEGITGRLRDALNEPPSVAWPAFEPEVTAPALRQPLLLAAGSGVLLALGLLLLLRRGPEA
jgi:hypothetical protein